MLGNADRPDYRQFSCRGALDHLPGTYAFEILKLWYVTPGELIL